MLRLNILVKTHEIFHACFLKIARTQVFLFLVARTYLVPIIESYYHRYDIVASESYTFKAIFLKIRPCSTYQKQ